MHDVYWDGTWSALEVWVMGLIMGAIAVYMEEWDGDELEEHASNGMFTGELQFMEWCWLNGARRHGWEWKK